LRDEALTILRAMPRTTDLRRARVANVAVTLIGAALATFAASSAEKPEGSRLFDADCAACHASDGRGRSSAEVGFDLPLPNFTDCRFATAEPDSDWSAIIHRGGPQRGFDRIMPAFEKALSDEEIDALVEHLRKFCTDPRWPRGDLNIPRAMFTEKAFPEDEAVVTTTIVTDGPNSFESEFSWEQRIGVLSQIEVSLPIERADLGDPTGWKTGAGDLAIAFKHVLHHDLERGSILAVGAEVALPTGDETKGFGSGTTVLEAQVMYDKLLPHDSFLEVQGLARFPHGSGLENEAELRLALGRTWTQDSGFGRAWTPMLEVLANRELAGGAQTEWDVVPQFQVTLSARQHVMAAAGWRIPVTQRDSRVNELVLYLLWDWYDGRILEGW
jgi:mono/diheme cytochrome c family protein